MNKRLDRPLISLEERNGVTFEELTDEELDELYEENEEAYQHSLGELELGLGGPSGAELAGFNNFIADVASACGVDDLPHISHVGHPAFGGESLLAQAARLSARAREVIETVFSRLPAEERAEAWSAISDAAVAGIALTLHRVDPLLQSARNLKETVQRGRVLDKERTLRTESATNARTNHTWRQGAVELWARHPTWTSWRVAQELVRTGGVAEGKHQGSVSRAIIKLAPRTSSSNPAHPRARGSKAVRVEDRPVLSLKKPTTDTANGRSTKD